MFLSLVLLVTILIFLCLAVEGKERRGAPVWRMVVGDRIRSCKGGYKSPVAREGSGLEIKESYTHTLPLSFPSRSSSLEPITLPY